MFLKRHIYVNKKRREINEAILMGSLNIFVYRATVCNELFSKYGQEVFDSKDRLVRNLTLKKTLYNRKNYYECVWRK